MNNKNKITPTQINEYNQFLVNMDKKFKLTNESDNNIIATEEKSLDDYIQFINKKYYHNNLNSSSYNGNTHHDIVISNIEINDVNNYLDTTIKLITPKKTKKKHISIHAGLSSSSKSTLSPTNSSTRIITKKVEIHKELHTIQDILTLIEENPADDSIEYNIDMKSLHNIKIPLQDLNNMIGMTELKQNVVDQLLYFIQELHLTTEPEINLFAKVALSADPIPMPEIEVTHSHCKHNHSNTTTNTNTNTNNKSKSVDFMHTVIYGPPGTGKTEIAKIIGAIYSKMGILKKGVFKKVTRSELIAGYLGQTAIKTKEVIQDCLGGVLFIDEAYALGNPEKKDSFAKECIDTLCEALSDHKHELMVIIAGYEHELNDCFFSYNQGLDSRFTWRFKTDDYQAEDLYNIFIKKIKDIGWSVRDIKVEWFKKNMATFPFFGRDMETLLAKTKIAHSKRVFGKPIEEKKIIILVDLEKGFEMYLNNENIKKKKEKEQFNQIISSIYV